MNIETLSSNQGVYLNQFQLNISEIDCGVLFLYCRWAYVETQLLNILNIQEKIEALNLYIFDIEQEDLFLKYRLSNPIESHGYGETYWVAKGKIIYKICKYNSSDDLKLAEKYSELLALEHF